MKNAICVNCRKHVEYELQNVSTRTIVKGKEVFYNQKIAYCKECGMEVWTEEVDDENSIAPIAAYCEMSGLITPIQIKEGLEKYNIGNRPMSKLLGWSEVTISRFLSGKLPSKTYSDKLMEIFENPKYFEKILIKNKSKITAIAYKKALEALNKIKYKDENISNFVYIYDFSKKIDYVTNKPQGGVSGWQALICNC